VVEDVNLPPQMSRVDAELLRDRAEQVDGRKCGYVGKDRENREHWSEVNKDTGGSTMI
jgi:hypothetical protein